jgi:hypothetical protein
MASSVSPLSYLDASAYQSLFPASSAASAAGASAAVSPTAVSPTAEVQALQKQGSFQSFLNESVVATLLQPSDGGSSGAAANTLINNMLQQVLGAYQTQSAGSPGTSGTSAVG